MRKAGGWTLAGALALAAGYLAVLVFKAPPPEELIRAWFLTPLGLFGAIIANSTGTGGGVVFIPAFNFLNHSGLMVLTQTNIVASSFLIQCFGMSVGSLKWLSRLRGQVRQLVIVRDICLPVLAGGLPALLLTQRLVSVDPETVLLIFKAFSIVVGLYLLASLLANRADTEGGQFDPGAERWMLAAIGVAGGSLTAFFSVGIGELLALYLFIRRVPVAVAVAPAVIVSAISVLAGAIWHLQMDTVNWTIVTLAVPGAMLGGYIASGIALAVGAFRLKLAASLWIVGSSLWLILNL